MNDQQFAAYNDRLIQIIEDRKPAYILTDRRNVVEKVTAKILRQTSFADGSSDVATRTWIDDIDLAGSRVGDQHIIDVVTSSITGSLRKEVELFIQNAWTANNIVREAVPWLAIRDHVIKTFLNVDEAAALRDSVDNLRQSAFESGASFTRRFREVAQKAYPVPRNVDQSRILVKAYARGLRSTGIEVKMIEHSNPQTLPQAMALVADFSERSDAVSRLGLRQVNDREEVPMEIAALPPPKSPSFPPDTTSSMLTKVLRSQEKLVSKIAKLEANQSSTPGSANRYAGGNDQRHATAPSQSHHNLPNWSDDGRPRCYACGEYGHFKRSCRARNDWHSSAPRPPFSQQQQRAPRPPFPQEQQQQGN